MLFNCAIHRQQFQTWKQENEEEETETNYIDIRSKKEENKQNPFVIRKRLERDCTVQRIYTTIHACVCFRISKLN